jgi:hypothetical protein
MPQAEQVACVVAGCCERATLIRRSRSDASVVDPKGCGFCDRHAELRGVHLSADAGLQFSDQTRAAMIRRMFAADRPIRLEPVSGRRTRLAGLGERSVSS